MAKQCSGTEIVGKLRQADVLLAQGKTVPEVCREIGFSQQTYYRWRNKYGGMSPDMIKQLRALQNQAARKRPMPRSSQPVPVAFLQGRILAAIRKASVLSLIPIKTLAGRYVFVHKPLN